MKKGIRTRSVLALLLALLLCCSLFATAVFAEEGDEVPASDGTKTQETTPTAPPTSPATTTTGTPTTGTPTTETPVTGEPGQETPQTPPAGPEMQSSNLAITAYNVVDAYGNEIWEVKPGDKVNLAFTLQDTAIDKSKLPDGKVDLSVHAGTGSFTVPREIKTTNRDAAEGLAFTVMMYDVTYLGGDANYTFTVAYHSNNVPVGIPIASFSQNIIQCKNVENVPSAKPAIVPISITASTNEVYAGESFTVTGVMKNTSSDAAVENITAVLSGSEKLKLANGSNTIFLGNAAAGASLTAQFALIADNNAEVGSYPATITYKGTWNGEEVSCTQEIAVNVMQKERFEISRVEMPDFMYTGEEQSMSVYFVNKGKGTIYNLSAEIEGNLSNPGQSQYLGNVNPGTENSVDFAILPGEAGMINGKVIFTYEDSEGNARTMEKEFSCQVEDMMMEEGPMDGGMMGGDMMDDGMMEEENKGVPVWVWVLVGLSVVIVAAVVTIVVLKKKKAKKLALEDEDEDI